MAILIASSGCDACNFLHL